MGRSSAQILCSARAVLGDPLHLPRAWANLAIILRCCEAKLYRVITALYVFLHPGGRCDAFRRSCCCVWTTVAIIHAQRARLLPLRAPRVFAKQRLLDAPRSFAGHFDVFSDCESAHAEQDGAERILPTTKIPATAIDEKGAARLPTDPFAGEMDGRGPQQTITSMASSTSGRWCDRGVERSHVVARMLAERGKPNGSWKEVGDITED